MGMKICIKRRKRRKCFRHLTKMMIFSCTISVQLFSRHGEIGFDSIE